jgi:FAD/FMN-containing dehydrogenase
VTGSPRDHVLGLELVTGDGRSLVLGGRVVKNVAGYDLVRLVVGSRGTLGLVTRAHLRLRALPETDVTAMWFAPQPAPLLETAARAEHAWPTAIELLSPAVAHAAAGKVHWMLMVRCAGNTDFVNDATLRLLGLTPDRVLAGDDAAAAWLALDRFEQRPAVAVRIGGPPASLAFLLDAAHELIRADAGRWRIAAHAANGIVRLWRPDPVDHDRAARLASAIDAARRILLESEGVIDLVEGEGLMPAGFDARVVSETERRLIDGIRRAFDPAGILSRPRPRPAA